jgi:hypothetical protein
VDPVLCTPGAYCPAGRAAPQQCPRGTYSSATGLTSQGDCTPCTPGSYCGSAGLTAPTGPCAAGYYCSIGANTSTPTRPSAQASGDICPAGYYCRRGAPRPTKCPLGSFMPTTGATNSTLCTAGSYCGSTGLTAPTAPCAAGYYCLTGAYERKPTDATTGGLCPVGYYCPAGTPFGTQTACNDGTYSNRTGTAVCPPTPAGTYGDADVSTSRTFPCPVGYYCPQGTYKAVLTTVMCPAGRYGARGSLAAYDDCTPCPAGTSCNAVGLTAPSGGCSAGYYCAQVRSVPVHTAPPRPPHVVHFPPSLYLSRARKTCTDAVWRTPAATCAPRATTARPTWARPSAARPGPSRTPRGRRRARTAPRAPTAPATT